MSKCKYCDAELKFIKTSNGYQMPCEAGRTEVWRLSKGKKKAITESGEIFNCETEYTPFIKSEYAFIPHFANCPGAGNARRKK